MINIHIYISQMLVFIYCYMLLYDIFMWPALRLELSLAENNLIYVHFFMISGFSPWSLTNSIEQVG